MHDQQDGDDPTDCADVTEGAPGGTPTPPASDVATVNDAFDPIQKACVRWFSGMNTTDQVTLVHGLREFASVSAVDSILVGTAFSGSDVCIHVMKNLTAAIDNHFGLRVEFSHTFASEKKAEKQQFLYSQFGVSPLFGDFHAVKEHTAFDIATKKYVVVPSVRVFMAGFPCQDKSDLNVNKQKFTKCILEKVGRTGD